MSSTLVGSGLDWAKLAWTHINPS